MKHFTLLLLSIFIIALSNYSFSLGGGPGGGDPVGPPAGLPSCSDEDPPGQDACNATPICNLNGYCETTSSSFTADYWSQLNSSFCGSIENNAFLTFTADSNAISFDAYVYNCNDDEAIQVFIFQSDGCSSGPVDDFVCVNEMYAQDTPYDVSASGLVPGEEYYIMIDGYAGDVCDYTFVANSGVSIPVVVSPDSSTICQGETVALTADGGDGNYDWDPSPDLSATTGANVTVTPPTTPGTYTYTVNSELDSTSNCGNQGYATATITVENCNCQVTTSNSGPVCIGDSFDLEATLGAGSVTAFSWDGPNGFTTSDQNPTGIVAPSTEGSYDFTFNATINGEDCSSTTTLEVIDCTGSCDTAAIRNAFQDAGCIELNSCVTGCSMYFLNPQSLTGTEAQTFAEGLGANLVSIHSQAENDCILTAINDIGQSGTIWIGFNDEAVEGEFVWYDQSPVGYTNWASGEPNNSGGDEDCVQIYPGGSEPGMWNDLPCDVGDSKSIIEVNLCPVVDAGPDITICEGDTATMGSTPTILGSAPYTYQWSNNGPTDYPNSVTPTETTDYILTSQDRYSCSGEDTMTVEVNPLPILDAGADTSICIGDSINLNINGSGTYTWDNGVTNGVTFAVDSTATYTVMATDAEGCVNSDSINVTAAPYPVPSFEGDELIGCKEHTVLFTSSDTLSNANCLWDFGDGETSDVCDSVSHTYTESGVYDVTLTIESAVGCTSDSTISNYIEVIDGPVAAFTADPMVTDFNNTEVVFTNESVSATNYLWDFGDMSSQVNDENPTHNFPNGTIGDYPVTLYAINDIGCVDTAVLNIQIVYPDVVYSIPNVFTPNGDSDNDFFKLIDAENISSIEVIILNRWGNLVFESDKVDFKWNGLKNNDGTECTDGTYFYKMKIKNMNGVEDNKHGFVQLSRGK